MDKLCLRRFVSDSSGNGNNISSIFGRGDFIEKKVLSVIEE